MVQNSQVHSSFHFGLIGTLKVVTFNTTNFLSHPISSKILASIDTNPILLTTIPNDQRWGRCTLQIAERLTSLNCDYTP